MQFVSYRRRSMVALAILLFGFSQTPFGFGASFEVSPIRVTFQPNESSALMTVRNEGDEKLRLQISVMAWDQSKEGEMMLKPTDDIIFYPTLLTVEPGAQRNLRKDRSKTLRPGITLYRRCSRADHAQLREARY